MRKCKYPTCNNYFRPKIVGGKEKVCCSSLCNQLNWILEHPERRKAHQIKYDRKIGKIPRGEWLINIQKNANPLKWRGWKWWQKISNAIRERDDYVCQSCGIDRYGGIRIVVHHIIPVKENGTHEENNLITLCNSCHLKIHRRKS